MVVFISNIDFGGSVCSAMQGLICAERMNLLHGLKDYFRDLWMESTLETFRKGEPLLDLPFLPIPKSDSVQDILNI